MVNVLDCRIVVSLDSKTIFLVNCLGKLKVLQYLGNIRHNLAVLGAFAEVMIVTNYTRL